jgi:hypothetical protein
LDGRDGGCGDFGVEFGQAGEEGAVDDADALVQFAIGRALDSTGDEYVTDLLVGLVGGRIRGEDVLDIVNDHLAKLLGEVGDRLEAKSAGVDWDIGEWLEDLREGGVGAVVEEDGGGKGRRARGRDQSGDDMRFRVGDVGGKGSDGLRIIFSNSDPPSFRGSIP